jgi:Pyruvate/2-oxoglutarate dehydrogenase complex, dihydrolipoamide acyltransferase (E2) component, and related enzymes
MILEMKVPSPGESITEVEIATWLVQDGDYVEKDQAIAEVDSDKATLELPAEASGIITLKAAEGDAVAVGEVVCLIDTSAAAPQAAASAKPVEKAANTAPAAPAPAAAVSEPATATYASGTPSPAAKKLLDEKGLEPNAVKGTGRDGRITKDDVVNANIAMGSVADGANRGQIRTKLSMLRRKVAERLVSAKTKRLCLPLLMRLTCLPCLSLELNTKSPSKRSTMLA